MQRCKFMSDIFVTRLAPPVLGLENKDVRKGVTKELRTTCDTAADDGEHAKTGLLSRQPSHVYAHYTQSPACFQ